MIAPKKQRSHSMQDNVVIAGDVAVDWFEWEVRGRSVHERNADGSSINNWQHSAGRRRSAKPGGALLIKHYYEQLTGCRTLSHSLEGIASSLETIPPERVIHSLARIGKFDRSRRDRKRKAFRVVKFNGFSGPLNGKLRPLSIKRDTPDADLVILDDSGNGFRDHAASWPAAIKSKHRSPIVLYKMSRPIIGKASPLWNELIKRHREKLVVIISIDDLRKDEVTVSRKLSWEQTAADLIWQFDNNPILVDLDISPYLIVRLGIEGAILRVRADKSAHLVFAPQQIEHGFSDEHPGLMIGPTSIFMAELARRVHAEGFSREALLEGIRGGIHLSQYVFESGFIPRFFSSTGAEGSGEADLEDIDHCCGAPLAEQTRKINRRETRIMSVAIPKMGNDRLSDWSILNGLMEDASCEHLTCVEELAYGIVQDGDAKALRDIPVGVFGKMKTIDRSEIENFRSIKNLIEIYVNTENPGRPLSIAVFGPPGSGKSFGVAQVAESVAPETIVTKGLEFNLSQFRVQGELIGALHKVRDVVLEGKIPLVFFDEFDCAFQEPLGWLKYFLAPMQDGRFRDGESTHPIGKAIFVFAGGTRSTLAEFSREEDTATGDEDRAAFVEAKGPDFVSRLKGYVNIKGPNPIASPATIGPIAREDIKPDDSDDDGAADPLCIVRRAMLIRSILERNPNSSHLVDPASGRIDIDEGVLRALLKIAKFKHGVRSIEALVSTSMLKGLNKFTQSALPPRGQLKLHVDAEAFTRLIASDVFNDLALERVARAIHECYLHDQHEAGVTDGLSPAMQPWEALDDHTKEANFAQAQHIPVKLQAIRCRYIAKRAIVCANAFTFTAEEVEKLSQIEHKRWWDWKLAQGWSYGPKRDDGTFVHPYMKPWEELPEHVREGNRSAIRNILVIMDRAGFAIYRP